MAKLILSDPVQKVSGKLSRSAKGYYYVDKDGRQLYRHREETYQKNQSPRQKWNSAAFAYAHRQLSALTATPDGLQAIEQEYHVAGKMNPTGTKTYASATGWKFVALQQEWRVAHPFDQWYADYVSSVQQAADENLSAGKVTKSMLENQISLLTDQLITLREQLNSLHS